MCEPRGRALGAGMQMIHGVGLKREGEVVQWPEMTGEESLPVLFRVPFLSFSAMPLSAGCLPASRVYGRSQRLAERAG